MTDPHPFVFEVRLAYEVRQVGPHTDEIAFVPVEAPPCGARLDIDERNVHLVCDKPRGHAESKNPEAAKHRAVIDAARGYGLRWCEDDCAHTCSGGLALNLRMLRELIAADWSDG